MIPVNPIDFAIDELGVVEWAHGSNPRILEYHSTTSLAAKDDAIPWCASFVSWCIDKAVRKGWKGPHSIGSASARSWLRWSVSSKKNPKFGDLCVFQRGKSKTSGHVAFFVEYTRLRTHIRVIGGNQGDQVCYANYPVWRLLDIRSAQFFKPEA
jgi:uncharacterized protein (TIGR02594 family)